MRYRLDKETAYKLKLIRKAKRAERKLRRRQDATWQQKHSWKCILAKAMRAFPTPSEKAMTPTLRRMGFLSQVILYGYIADFAHETKRIIVEVDGKIHEQQQDYDRERDDVFRIHGWRVMRFTNERVGKEPAKIINEIMEALS